MQFFLLSDIEGSTSRWDANRDAMRSALREHDAILNSAITSHGGTVFKTAGDAFYAVFALVEHALAAAHDAQRRLLAQDWSAVGGLFVRMAIDAGETEARNGDYFGPALNRASRLLSIANGGQVLVSAAAADAANGTVENGLALRPCGAMVLRGLQAPEQVFQLTASDLPSEFKPLRSARATANNLPRQPTAFFGRDADIARIEDLLRRASLVTIVGAGGVGKTRTALQIAYNLLDQMDDGAWFVDFAPISDESLVAATTLSALGVTESDGRPQLERLLNYLRPRRTLIVFDNCEHVILEAARADAAILQQCPQVTLLATSRERLHIAGEVLYELPALDAEAAIKLFADRAKIVDPQFTVTKQNRQLVESICERLDRIALAIELAAPRLRTLSLEQLSKYLDERFRILVGGSRTALPRHQTVRALIDWSYDLLGEVEQRFFRRAGVFAGSFSLEAAYFNLRR